MIESEAETCSDTLQPFLDCSRAIELAKLTSCRIGNFQNFGQILAIYNEIPYTGDLERPGAEAGFDRFRVVEAI